MLEAGICDLVGRRSQRESRRRHRLQTCHVLRPTSGLHLGSAPLELLESEAGLIRETAHQDDRGGLRLGDDHLPGDGEHELRRAPITIGERREERTPIRRPARATLPEPQAERHG